jgi:hypothetical protein
MFKKSFLVISLLMSFQAHTMFQKTIVALATKKSDEIAKAAKFLSKHGCVIRKQNNNILELEQFGNFENRKKITISSDPCLQVSIEQSNMISIPSPRTPDGGQYDVAGYQTTYRKTETWYPSSVDQLLRILKDQVK